MIFLLTLTFCLLGVVLTEPVASQCVSCRNISMKEDIDWYRMHDIKRSWYDVVDIPSRYAAVDCWNLDRFTPVENGVVIEFSEWAPRGNGKTLFMHYIRVEGKIGIYKPSQEHRDYFSNKTIEALGHKPDEETIEGIQLMTNNLFDAEYYFITDYENYFMLGICDEDGSWIAWVKFRPQLPTIHDLVRLWNVMTEHGMCGTLFLKETCIHREYTDECPK